MYIAQRSGLLRFHNDHVAAHNLSNIDGIVPMHEASLRAEVMKPSELGEGELVAWREMLAASENLQRAFFDPAFALACESATGLAYVGILYEGATVRAILPFQFRSVWHRRIRLAHRIGGELSDNAGLIAWPDVRITNTGLLRLCRLASLNLSHIMEGQDQFGLDVDWSDISYVTNLSGGSDAYFADLLANNRHFVRDTQRQERKAVSIYGPVSVQEVPEISQAALASVIEMKRLQYQRTQVSDPFASPENLRLLETLRQSAVPECALTLVTLEAGGKMIAQHLGLRHRDVLSWWFPVYSVSAQGISPGRLLLWHLLRDAARNGIRLIDYGAGDARYKQQFSTASLRMGRAVWTADNPRSLLAKAWQSVEWRLRG